MFRSIIFPKLGNHLLHATPHLPGEFPGVVKRNCSDQFPTLLPHTHSPCSGTSNSRKSNDDVTLLPGVKKEPKVVPSELWKEKYSRHNYSHFFSLLQKPRFSVWQKWEKRKKTLEKKTSLRQYSRWGLEPIRIPLGKSDCWCWWRCCSIDTRLESEC